MSKSDYDSRVVCVLHHHNELDLSSSSVGIQLISMVSGAIQIHVSW